MDGWSSSELVDASAVARGAASPGGVRPFFFWKTVEDKQAKDETGEPKLKDAEYVRLQIPGDRNNIPEVPVTDEHRRQYAAIYKHWKATRENPLMGVPLSELPAIMGSQVETLRYHGIHTIEDLAGLSDDLMARLGTGTRALVHRAKDWLSKGKENAGSEKMRNELQKRDVEIAALKKQMEALLEAKTEKPKKGG